MRKIKIDDAFLQEKRVITHDDLRELGRRLWNVSECDIGFSIPFHFCEVVLKNSREPLYGWVIQVLYGDVVPYRALYRPEFSEIMVLLSNEVEYIKKIGDKELIGGYSH